MKVAFYAPMKPPNHPVPSGDRRVARLLMDALDQAGYVPELASELRAFDKHGDIDFQKKIRNQAALEAERIIADYKNRSPENRPVAWFTYHLYHKAPDWIGSVVCEALHIPYLVAEASHAPKQEKGPWALGYESAAAAIASANRVFHMTRLDGECLKPLLSNEEALVYLPPFIATNLPSVAMDQVDILLNEAGGKPDKFNLLSVAMMRSGDKLVSYRQLAEALDYLKGDDWQLVIVGDGDERGTVEEHLKDHMNKVVFTGARDLHALFGLYQKADLYVWPAHGEAYGMAFLEAQLNGLPVVAGNIRGVPDVVINARTGILSPPGDMLKFAQSIRALLDNPEKRKAMSIHAKEFVVGERSLNKAAKTLKDQLRQCIK